MNGYKLELTAEELQELLTPVGTVISFMGINPPKGYLACDGTEYNISDYPRFVDFLIQQFGSANHFGGDGIDTFCVPDLRGEFLRGTGSNTHINPSLEIVEGAGANVGEHQAATTNTNAFYVNNTYYVYKSNASKNSIVRNFDTMLNTVSQGKVSIGDSTYNYPYPSEFTSRPTNTSVLYCIKY